MAQETGNSGALPPVRLTLEQAKARRRRSVAIGLCVGALCLLFYFITMARLGMKFGG